MRGRFEATGDRTVRLYEAKLPGPAGKGITDRQLIYRAKIKTQDVKGRAYVEMWLRETSGPKSFSRGFDDAVSGTTDWVEVQTPFWIKDGERADQADLNVVIEGGGTIWIKDIVLQAHPRPRTPAESLRNWLQRQLGAAPAKPADTADFDQLVELAEDTLQRVKTMAEAGSVSSSEVFEAERSLLSAKLQRAATSSDVDGAEKNVQQLIHGAEQQLSQAQALHEIGAAPVAKVRDAERQVLEARITLAELQDDQQELLKGLRRLVELSEQSLKELQELSEHGTGTQREVEDAQKELMKTRVRLRRSNASLSDQ